MKKKIVIIIEGGMVSSVYFNSDLKLDVEIVDLDSQFDAANARQMEVESDKNFHEIA